MTPLRRRRECAQLYLSAFDAVPLPASVAFFFFLPRQKKFYLNTITTEEGHFSERLLKASFSSQLAPLLAAWCSVSMRTISLIDSSE